MNEQRVAKIAKALLNGSLVRVGGQSWDIDDVLRDFEFQDPEGWQRLIAAAERVARAVVMLEDKER